MRRAFAALAGIALLVAPSARAASLSPDGIIIRDCLTAAGNAYHEPPAILVILLNVEGGRLGAVSPNSNGTVDVGPMQVNDIWLPKLAEHWATSRQNAFVALRDNFCANIEAGAWILRMGLDEAHGDFWEGVGIYHSHDPEYKQAYLSSVLKQALRLQEQARSPAPPSAPAVLPKAPTEDAAQHLPAAPTHDAPGRGY